MADTSVSERARQIEVVSFDVDGVLTDGKLYYSDDGGEIKAFHVADGAALKLLQEHAITVAILTGRESSMVARRARELGIKHLFQGLTDKVVALEALCDQVGCAPAQVAHVGDDIPDIGVFDRVGLAISVPNGHWVAREHAHHVTRTSGGAGVGREVAELILRARGRWPYG